MNKNYLEDWKKWKDLNKESFFTIYDYLYHIVNLKNLNADIFFAFQELIWPSFFIFEKYVFLKENFSREKYYTLKNQNQNLEYWLNFLSIDPFFSNDENGEKKAEIFSIILRNIWELKLKNDFPNLKFEIKCLFDFENGDFGITFYQVFL
jgi:hypothetical protein